MKKIDDGANPGSTIADRPAGVRNRGLELELHRSGGGAQSDAMTCNAGSCTKAVSAASSAVLAHPSATMIQELLIASAMSHQSSE